MARKVKVALFGKDLKCEIMKYPLNSDGTKIEIQPKGGKGYFMPAIDKESGIDMPRRKKFFFFGELVYETVYFAMKWSKKCINFHTGEVKGPDPKQVMDAATAEIIKNRGKQKQQNTNILLILVIIILLMQFVTWKVLGVF